MGLLSDLKRSAEAARNARSPLEDREGEELWRRTRFLTRSLGEDLQVVYVRGGRPQTFPTFAIDFVLGCREFGSLESHLEYFAEKHAWNGLQVEGLRAWLPQLVSSGLLISGGELRRKCAAFRSAEAAPPPIQFIGFPTGGNRLALLNRCLQSFAANARQHGRDVAFVVADGSAEQAHTRQNAAALLALGREYDVRSCFIGPEEKERLATRLAAVSAINRATVEFAIADPLQAGFSCGANRNTLLLHGSGKMFCSVDDDVVCRLAFSPQADTQLSSFSQYDPFVRRFFPRRELAFAAAHWEEADFVSLHEAMLGKELGTFFGSEPGQPPLDLTHVGDDFLARIESGRTHVRTTFTGHVGDPGMPTSVYYLFAEGEGRRALPEDERDYRAVFTSRSVLTCVKHRALGDGTVSPGMAMGLDHRELLPPFFPVLHAEDYVFGATTWQCCRDAIAGHLPVAVLHDPPGGKPLLLPSDLNRDRRAVIFEFAHILRGITLHEFEPAQTASSAERMKAFGRMISERAALPSADFEDYLRTRILEQQSNIVQYFEEELASAENPPEPWRRDVVQFVAHIREALTFDDFDIPFELKELRSAPENRALMQSLLANYGALLEAWPALVAAAGEMHANGDWEQCLGGK